MPWQIAVADVAGELRPDGRPAYREVRVTVPRQSGKTTLLLCEMVYRALAYGEAQRIAYTAQDRLSARQKWEEHCRMLRDSAFASLFDIRRANGTEAINWKSPAPASEYVIVASGETSGHGQTLDMGVIDEAFAQTDERLVQAFRPAMITRPHAQLWIISTAGTDDSTFLRERVDDGRARAEAGDTDSVAYFEWSAADDADPASEEVWLATMPALGITVDLEIIRDEFRAMPVDEFCRAYLNQWTAGRGAPALDPVAWASCAYPESQAGTGALTFAIDVAVDRSTAAIGCASRRGGRIHIEVVDHRPGTGWIVERVIELQRQWRPISWVLDPVSPAGSLIVDLLAAGVAVDAIDTRRLVHACGGFYDAVRDGNIEHRGQAVLDAAVAGARRRNLGDSWAWARRAGTDISPLMVVTLAWSQLARLGVGEVQIL